MSARGRISVAGVLLAAGLAACSPSNVMERLPESLGGLPADAPARPANQYHYPAVHDMPPSRPLKTLSDADQRKLESELQTMRDKQAQDAAAAAAANSNLPPLPEPLKPAAPAKPAPKAKKPASKSAQSGAAAKP
jgi:hypothetical protein